MIYGYQRIWLMADIYIKNLNTKQDLYKKKKEHKCSCE